MRQFNAAHLEIKKTFSEDFETHPFEAGWASEAIFFIMIEEVGGGEATLDTHVQISHDGVNWADEGTSLEQMRNKGLHFIRVKHFGNWLRLKCRIKGDDPAFRLNLQIALKE